MTGAEVSTGWITRLLPKAAALFQGPIRLIKALLVLGHVLNTDETTTNIAGRRRYLHVACTKTLIFLGLARDPARAQPASGPCRTFAAPSSTTPTSSSATAFPTRATNCAQAM